VTRPVTVAPSAESTTSIPVNAPLVPKSNGESTSCRPLNTTDFTYQGVWFSGVVGPWNVVGSAALRGDLLRLNAWQETGGDGLWLSAERQRRRSSQGDVQVQFMRRASPIAPWFGASYRRELTPTIRHLRIGESADGLFCVRGQLLSRSAAGGVGGVRLAGAHAAVSLSYGIRYSQRQTHHAVELAFGFE
jgi:hypothetical protein